MPNKLLALMRPEIVAMNAYRSARSEQIDAANKIWLDANENSWGNTYNRYPEPQPCSLTTTLASLYAADSKQILVTRGSDEGIDLLVRLFCHARQDQIMICPPTYGMYKVAATIQGAGVVEVALIKTENFSLNLNAILQEWQPNIKIIFLCSPNNPTGNLLATSDILAICQKLEEKAIVVVDEAYIEFSGTNGLGKYINVHSNLVVLRTLSKAHGLAGIRLGATIANPNIIQILKKIIAPYPIAKPTADIAYEQLKSDYINKQIELINKEKDKLFLFLIKLPFVKKVWESKANFLLFEVTDSQKIMEACFKHGVVLRDRSHEYALKNCIRATIGNPNENKFLMEALNYV
ncbi:Histidinol-phosphate aminotransferase 1 [Gammaproteobacteria bacterium]